MFFRLTTTQRGPKFSYPTSPMTDRFDDTGWTVNRATGGRAFHRAHEVDMLAGTAVAVDHRVLVPGRSGETMAGGRLRDPVQRAWLLWPILADPSRLAVGWEGIE